MILADKTQVHGLEGVSRDVDLILGITENEAKFVRIFCEPFVFVAFGKLCTGITRQIKVEGKSSLVVARAGISGIGHCNALGVVRRERGLSD